MGEIEVTGEFPSGEVLFASCDTKYFNDFRIPLAYSCNETNNDLHLHVMHPSEDDYGTAAVLKNDLDINFTVSFEEGGPKTREYYSCNRFIIAPHIINNGVDMPKNDEDFEENGFLNASIVSNNDLKTNLENGREANREAISLNVERSEFDKAYKEPSRFGINKLINRMTGSSEALAEKIEVKTKHNEKEVEVKDTTEIPAFLRRQAN